MNAALTGRAITDNRGLNVRKLAYGKIGDEMKDSGLKPLLHKTKRTLRCKSGDG